MTNNYAGLFLISYFGGEGGCRLGNGKTLLKISDSG